MSDNPNKWPDKQWIALYTKPRAEKQVALKLTQAGLENYVPLLKERRRWSDRMKWVEVALIPSYVFCKILDKELHVARQVDGVVCPVTIGLSRSEVARIPDNQMDDFKTMVEYQKGLKVLSAGQFVKGAYVEVVAGDYMGLKGHVVSVDGNDMFGITLEGVSMTIAASIDMQFLNIIDDPNKPFKKSKSKTLNQ